MLELGFQELNAGSGSGEDGAYKWRRHWHGCKS